MPVLAETASRKPDCSALGWLRVRLVVRHKDHFGLIAVWVGDRQLHGTVVHAEQSMRMHATLKNVDQNSGKIRGDCTIIKLTSLGLLLNSFAEPT
ncbi:hypothetical protein CEP54_003615 [Fusarium duplospermum]|uniref:Uncharacterized protein n=1 Tax=Fusarium duplospermum TaxID=1325734 RepID=A0A428QN62_9HYPO|nr:hypothetical protein CEP54_003615 [Fusarium duplospermum]